MNVERVKDALHRIKALCENPHWTAERRWRIQILTEGALKEIEGEKPSPLPVVDDRPRCLACGELEDAHPVSRTSVSDNADEVLICGTFQKAAVEEGLDSGPPCRPDGTPVFPRRKLSRDERLQEAADAGFDTWDDYRGNR